jgi:hypothetical protein
LKKDTIHYGNGHWFLIVTPSQKTPRPIPIKYFDPFDIVCVVCDLDLGNHI